MWKFNILGEALLDYKKNEIDNFLVPLYFEFEGDTATVW